GQAAKYAGIAAARLVGGRRAAVQLQGAFVAQVPLAMLGLEHAAVGHFVLVDVHADREVGATGIADGVVFVRRDQAAGRARAGLDDAGRDEAVAGVVVLAQFVLHHFQRTLPDGFDTPHAGVVVDRRALAGAPGHCDHAVTVFGAAIELAPRVVLGAAFEDAVGQAHVARANRVAQCRPQRAHGADGVVGDHGCVESADQFVATLEVHAHGTSI